MLTRLLAYVRGLLRRKTIDAEVEEELRFHVEMEIQANLERGMAAQEAHRVALRDVGGVTQTREAVRRLRATFLDGAWQDGRFALRAFRRSPGYALVAVVVLSLGIAANTTLFSLVNAVLFRPLPVPDAGGLRFLSVVYPHISDRLNAVPYSTFTQLAERRDVFAGIAGFLPDYAKFGNGIAAARVQGERVTTGYFDVLRAKAAVGRTFVPSDDEASGAPAIVVSDRFWRGRLNADPRVVGTTLEMRPAAYSQHYSSYRRTYTIVGVMPPGFNGLSSVWVPAEVLGPAAPAHGRLGRWQRRRGYYAGRLGGGAPGVARRHRRGAIAAWRHRCGSSGRRAGGRAGDARGALGHVTRHEPRERHHRLRGGGPWPPAVRPASQCRARPPGSGAHDRSGASFC